MKRTAADPKEDLPLSFPTLYKQAASGGVVEWDLSVLPSEVGAVIATKWGQRGGKKQESRDVITVGKKVGTKAETSPEGQAILQAKADWKKKLERGGYGQDAGAKQSAAKRSLSPMLALDYEDYKDKLPPGRMFMQPKFDGHRGFAHVSHEDVTIFSRKGEEVTTMEHIREHLKKLCPKVKDLGVQMVVVDGEIFSDETDFDGIASAIRKKSGGSDAARSLLKHHVYDLLIPEQPELGYGDRWNILCNVLGIPGLGGPVEMTRTVECKNLANLDAFASDCVAAGYEGAMLRLDGPYEPGKRSKTLLKVKSFKDGEFLVVDVAGGSGSYADMAIFTCETKEGKRFTVTAPGTYDQKRLYLKEAKAWIGKDLTVKFFSTTPDGMPRFPVALRFRED